MQKILYISFYIIGKNAQTLASSVSAEAKMTRNRFVIKVGGYQLPHLMNIRLSIIELIHLYRETERKKDNRRSAVLRTLLKTAVVVSCKARNLSRFTKIRRKSSALVNGNIKFCIHSLGIPQVKPLVSRVPPSRQCMGEICRKASWKRIETRMPQYGIHRTLCSW